VRGYSRYQEGINRRGFNFSVTLGPFLKGQTRLGSRSAWGDSKLAPFAVFTFYSNFPLNHKLIILNMGVCILLRVLGKVQGSPSNATLFQ
jgi:hypothetical protein